MKLCVKFVNGKVKVKSIVMDAFIYYRNMIKMELVGEQKNVGVKHKLEN